MALAGSPKLFEHTDQLGQRLGPRFLHHMRPVGLDRELAGPEFARDLFVQ